MRLFRVFAIFVSFSSWTVSGLNNATFDAQQLASIPTCAMENCLIYTIPEVGCGMLDIACHCQTNVTHRLATVTANCMYANCTFQDALKLAKIQAALCDFPFESRNGFLKIMTVVCTIITYGAVILRLITRYLLGQTLGKDDYFILAAAVSDAIFTSLGERFIQNGFGEHIWSIDQSKVSQLLLFFYLCEIFYVTTIALIKYSILFFYLRIFPKRSFRIICWTIIGFCTASAIAFAGVTIFQCQPIQFVWNKGSGGKCLNYNAAAFANAGVNIIQDMIILILPISEIRNLQLTKKKKIGMYVMFSMGGLVCLFSVIRLHSLKQFGFTADPTWDNVNMTFWTTLETTAAVFCACMPSIRALGVRYFPRVIGSQGSNARTATDFRIYVSHDTRVHTSKRESSEWRPESQESWIHQNHIGTKLTFLDTSDHTSDQASDHLGQDKNPKTSGT